jgi:hypothetical protein
MSWIAASTGRIDVRVRGQQAKTTAAEHVDSDPLKGTQATGHWIPEEDFKVNIAITNTCKRKYGKEYQTD